MKRPATRGSPGLWAVLSVPLLLFLAVPLLGLILRSSPSAVLGHLARPEVRQAIWLSFATTFAAALLTVAIGTPVAYLISRYRFPFWRVVDALVDLPILLPPAVAGIALLAAFGREGVLGGVLSQMGISLSFTSGAVVLAQMFIASPFYIRAAVIGFSNVDEEIEAAAMLEGAGHWQVFRAITAPLAWTALAGGAVMAWTRALGEFGATIIFAGNFPGRTQTMPLLIYLGFELDLELAFTLSLILFVFALLMLSVVKTLLARYGHDAH